MTDFAPDQVGFGDLPGYGDWQDGHHREHLAFADAFAIQSVPVLIPPYDFLSFLTNPTPANIGDHQSIHALINARLGLTSIDFGQLDLTNEDDFYSWLGYHATAHQQIRQALGLT